MSNKRVIIANFNASIIYKLKLPAQVIKCDVSGHNAPVL